MNELQQSLPILGSVVRPLANQYLACRPEDESSLGCSIKTYNYIMQEILYARAKWRRFQDKLHEAIVTLEGKGAPRQIGQFVRGEFMEARAPGWALNWEHSDKDEGVKLWGTESDAKGVQKGQKPKNLTRQMAYMKLLAKDKELNEPGAPSCNLFNRGLNDKAYRT